MNNTIVIGAGSWGTAFANYLAGHLGSCRLWVREAEIAAAMREKRENPVFLSGIPLHEGLQPVTDLAEAATADIVIHAVPSKFSRAVFQELKEILPPHAALVNLSKGFEAGSLHTLSQIAADVFGPQILSRWVTLSGPSFALELARRHPTAIVGAAADEQLVGRIQQLFSSTVLRVYRSDDLRGVEVGGAVKNVMAIASGMIDGLGFGYNTIATLVTRASVEISRLGQVLGAKPETFFGLAGIGDLMLTCFGPLSRNFQFGRRIAQGGSLPEVESSTPMVVEGIETTKAVHSLCLRYGIDMPISQAVYHVLFTNKAPFDAIQELMKRSLKIEWNIK